MTVFSTAKESTLSMSTLRGSLLPRAAEFPGRDVQGQHDESNKRAKQKQSFPHCFARGTESQRGRKRSAMIW
eukprot:5167830-Amphidinium_carterae.1